MGTLRLFAPLAHQEPIQAADCRWPVWRGGRRSGKTEWAGYAITNGRGPIVEGIPKYRGLLHGMDAAWIVRDYTQSLIFWRDYIIPTFGEVCQLNASDRFVDVPTGGRLWIRSSENIASIRGMGKNLGCVLFEEAAHYHTMTAFRAEIRPMLMDNKGWAGWISSTKAGSEFNVLCEEIAAGIRKPEDGWQVFHSTPYDNPLLDTDEIDALVAEYPPGSDVLREEVFAELLGGGAGLAFPEWRKDLHEARVEPLPDAWAYTMGLDWGYDPDDGVAYMEAHGPDGRNHGCFEYVFQRKTPEVAGYELGVQLVQVGRYPECITYDPSMNAVHDGGPTILEKFKLGLNQALPMLRIALIPAPTGRRGPRGETSREIGKLLFHEQLRYWPAEDGTVPPWGRPKWTIDPVRCPRLAAMFPKLVKDEKRPSDVATEGQWEHGWDAKRYLTLHRTPVVHGPPEVIPVDIHPGFIPGTTERRGRIRTPEVEVAEAKRSYEAMGYGQRGRFQRPPR